MGSWNGVSEEGRRKRNLGGCDSVTEKSGLEEAGEGKIRGVGGAKWRSR